MRETEKVLDDYMDDKRSLKNQHNSKKMCIFAASFGALTCEAPTDRITDTNMQNEQHNTLILREKYPPYHTVAV